MAWLVAIAFAGYTPVEHPLPQGDTLVVVEDHRVPVVQLRIDFPVSRYSPWALAHDASTAWDIQRFDPDRTLRARADALAVRLNLSHSTESATLTLTCLRDDVDAAVQLLDEILHNTAFDRAQLRTERRRRRGERRGDRKDPGHQGDLAVRALLFVPDDPRRRPWEPPERLIANPTALAATRDAVLAQPGRIVGVSGDVDRALGETIAARLLPAPLPIDGDVLPPYDAVATPPADSDLTIPMPQINQVTFRWVRDGLSWTQDRDDLPAALVANHVLAGHAHARLGQALRYDAGATYSVKLHNAVAMERDALTIHTYTRANNAAAAEQILRDTLATFHEGGITDAERDDAVAHILGSEAFRQQGPWTAMGTRMWELRNGLPEGTFEASRRAVRSVSTEQVNAFIARFYDPAAFTMVRVVPK